MSARERFLLTLTIAGIGMMLLFFGGRSVYRLFSNLENEIASADDAYVQKDRTRRKMNLDKREIRKKAQRSLSSDPDRAQTQYKSWLLQLAKDNDMDGFIIMSGSFVPVGKTYYRHSFRITGNTNLVKGVDFLHSFYSAPVMHRLRELHLLPGKGKEIRLTATIEAIGLMDSTLQLMDIPVATEIGDEPVTDVLAKSDIKDYFDSIIRRNLFGPPNKPPTFSGSSIVPLTVGKQEQFSIRASAQERDQKIVSFELVKTNMDPPPTISRSGSVRVRSDEEKSYKMTVMVTDDGFPSKVAEKEYTLRFSPERQARPTARPTPRFDNAQLAFFTSTVQIGDRVEAWILRRESGELLKLHVGDKLQIGTIVGTVREITFKTIEIETSDGTLLIKHGQNLSEATKVTSVGVAPSGDVGAR